METSSRLDSLRYPIKYFSYFTHYVIIFFGQLVGDWYLAKDVYNKRSEPSESAESSDCTHAHVEKLEDDKFKITYHEKYTSTTPPKYNVPLVYSVQHVDDSIVMQNYFDKSLKEDRPESERGIDLSLF